MRIERVSLLTAKDFVSVNHRHNRPPLGHKFSLGLYLFDSLIGVAIVGNPIARHLNDSETLEVTRLCTLGHYNACSKLYGACKKLARKMGYKKLITYTRIDEPGASLRASGFSAVHTTKAETWNRPCRPRSAETELIRKIRWEINL